METTILTPILSLDVELEIGTLIKEYPSGTYDGPYEIKPKHNEQILNTKDKTMTDDLTVEEIPYSEVTNPQGGVTVYIE